MDLEKRVKALEKELAALTAERQMIERPVEIAVKNTMDASLFDGCANTYK